MKKHLLLAVALLLMLTPSWSMPVVTQSQEQPILTTIIIIVPIFPRHPRPRTGVDLIDAQLDSFSNQLSINFNESVGRVTVDVTNSIGQVVSRYSCNTNMKSMINMNIPDAPDHYAINIVGSDIEAYGYFDLVERSY